VAKKYKVVGQKNLAQRIPNANTFESNTSTTLFDMGTFKLTTNLMPAAVANYESRLVVKRTLVSLEDLRLKSLEHAKLVSDVTSKLVLNADKTNLNSYACFGSLKELLRVSVSNIIQKWPGSLYVDPSYTDPTQAFTTVVNYTYNETSNISSFDVNATLIENRFGLNINSAITTDDIKNVVVNYTDYVIEYNGNVFPVLTFVGTTAAAPTTIRLSAQGDVFPDRDTPGTSTLTRTFHIHANETHFSAFHKTLGNLERYLLNRERPTRYEAIFRFPGEDEDGNVEFFDIPAAWPVSDGYNVDSEGSRFDIYLNSLLGLGQSYDEFKTNLIIRQLIPSSYLQLDYTSSKKGEKLLALYGRQFDEIKAFIDGLVYVNTITYNKVNNAPDAVVYNLAQTLGWDVFPFMEEQDLLHSVFGTAVTTSNQQSFTPTEVNIELWRRIIINTGYLLRSKGTRQAIETIFSMIGAPDSLIEINEHIYLTDRVVAVGGTTRNTLQFDSFTDDDANAVQYAYPANSEEIIFESTLENEFSRTLEEQGFRLNRVVDNKKSWIGQDYASRDDEELSTSYQQGEQRTVINTKQMSLSLTISKALNYSGYHMAQQTPEFSGLTFMQFLSKVNDHIPATSRKTVLNQYPTLTALYESYRSAHPGMALNQSQVLDIIAKIDGSWSRLLNQMLPATTILNERGVTMANSVFTPQKFTYKRGINAGSTHATKQPERIEDAIRVASLDTGIDEEIQALLFPVSVKADVFDSSDGNLNNGSGFSVLTDRMTTSMTAKGSFSSYNNIALSSVVGAGPFTIALGTQNTVSADSAIYQIDQNSAKTVTITYPNNDRYNQLINSNAAVFGFKVFELTFDGNTYHATSVLTGFIPNGRLTKTNLSVVLNIDNRVLKTDSQYFISPFYELAVGLDIVPYTRQYPLDYHDSYAINQYPGQFAAHPKYYNRNLPVPKINVSTERNPLPDASLDKVVKPTTDYAFITISKPETPALVTTGQVINPTASYTQTITFTTGGTTEIALQYQSIGPVTASLNGTTLTAAQFAHSALYSAATNQVVFALNVVTNPGDVLALTYYTAQRPIDFMQNSFRIGSQGLEYSNTLLLNGTTYATMELAEVPQIDSVKVDANGTILSPVALVPGTTKSIYFPYGQSLYPGVLVTASYLKAQPGNVDFITFNPYMQYVSWSVPNKLPNPANGLFRFEFVAGTNSAGDKIIPDFTTPLYTVNSNYVAQSRNFNFGILLNSVPALSSYEYLYFRIISKKNVVGFGTAGTFSEETAGDTYMVRLPGAIVNNTM
jgi:hypothetical protein